MARPVPIYRDFKFKERFYTDSKFKEAVLENIIVLNERFFEVPFLQQLGLSQNR